MLRGLFTSAVANKAYLRGNPLGLVCVRGAVKCRRPVCSLSRERGGENSSAIAYSTHVAWDGPSVLSGSGPAEVRPAYDVFIIPPRFLFLFFAHGFLVAGAPVYGRECCNTQPEIQTRGLVDRALHTVKCYQNFSALQRRPGAYERASALSISTTVDTGMTFVQVVILQRVCHC